MYTKVLELDGQPHLAFFARQDIRIGQELTYDYRFKEEEGDNKLPCQCGAPNCRGFLN
jgi:SET domain-containing protein